MNSVKSTFLAIALICSAMTSANPAATDWLKTDGADLRLIAQPTSNPMRFTAGLEIKLKPGWKTYWRNPGGSGIPPQIQFLGSTNVAKTEFLYPAPKVFREADGTSIGYKHHVVFPINVHLKQAGHKTVLHAKGVLGICAEICIPETFDLKLENALGKGTDFDLISALNSALSSLPEPDLGSDTITAPMVDENDLITASVKVSADVENPELLVEGPISWYLQPAKLISREGNAALFSIGVPKSVGKEKLLATNLRLTLIGGKKAIVATHRVKSAIKP